MKNIKFSNLLKEEIWKIKLFEGGQAPGKLEIVKLNYEKAKNFMESINLLDQIDDFESKFEYAKRLANLGKTKRKDMPVIDDQDVKKFQLRLKLGTLDINEPFAAETNPQNPWPEGLSGWEAQDFVKRGLKDGAKKDDVIGITIGKVEVGKLKPIQKQIYFDKSMKSTAESGAKKTLNWLGNKTFFITSADNFIIDGHHRWLSGIVLDPNLKVNTLSIDLPIKDLLPMAIAYGDAIGNKRNQ
jgi:hypothetical protein